MDYREKLIYLAGIIDGEGSFGMYHSKRLNRHYLTVDVYNTCTKLMNWLQENFPGEYREIKAPSKTIHVNWKTTYIWRSNNNQTLQLLNDVLPFLIVKTKQCEVAIKFRETFIKRECPVSQKTRDLRRSLYEQMIILNQKNGRGPIKVPPCLPPT